MHKLVLVSGVLVLGYYVSSCAVSSESGGSTRQPAPQVSTEEVVESQALKTGDRIYSLVLPPQTAQNPGIPTMPMGSGMMSVKSSNQGSNWTCSGNTNGNLTDADGDDIPVDGTYEFQCEMSAPQCTMTHSGKVNIKDDNDNDKLSGYDVCTGTISNDQCSREPITMSGNCGSGQSGKLERVFDFDLDRSGNNYNFTTFFFEWRFYDSQTATTPQATATLESQNLSFASENDGDDDIFDNGTWNGTITLSFGVEGGESGSCSITFNDLRITETCNGAESGSVEYTCDCPSGSVEPNFILTVNITSCNSGSVSWTDCDGNSGSVTF